MTSFIVVEGCDNVGKTTFVNEFVKQFPDFTRMKLPTAAVYSVIKTLPPPTHHDHFHADIVMAMNEIRKSLADGVNIILDRYVYSHYVYEALTSKQMCTFDQIVQPNAILYLRANDVSTLSKEDNIERFVDYSQIQNLFDQVFKGCRNVITVQALKEETIAIAITKLKSLM